MNRDRIAAAIMLSALSTLILAVPVAAHEKEHPEDKRAAAKTVALDPSSPLGSAARSSMVMDTPSAPMTHDIEARSRMTAAQRTLDWLGRLHVSIIHFPLAFFPAALFAGVLGRRRAGYARPVRFLVIAGGVTAPVAALLGWFDGGIVIRDADPLLAVHRWLGTGIGVGGLILAGWAWKRPDANGNIGMLVALAVITAALFVQGWFGGSMIHGVEHMNW